MKNWLRELIKLHTTLLSTTGFDVFKQIRQAIGLRLVMLIGRGNINNKVQGSKLWADDCVIQSYGMSESVFSR